MRIEQLAYIVEVAREGSVTKAAKNLFISQPSLSNAITALEDELGLKIFSRTRSGAELTAVGQFIVTHAQTIMDEIAEINSLAKSNRIIEQDKFCIVTTPIFSRDFVLNVMLRFKDSFPNTDIVIHEDFLENIITRISNLEDSLAFIVYSSKIKPILLKDCQYKSLTLQVLYQDQFLVFLHRNHPLAQASSLTMTQLNDYDTAILSSHPYKSPFTHIEPIFSSSRAHYCCLQDLSSLKRLVADFGYLTLLPSVCYHDDLRIKNGEILSIPIEDINEYFEVALLVNPNRTHSYQEELFITLAKELAPAYF